jgi:hypothetical protein
MQEDNCSRRRHSGWQRRSSRSAAHGIAMYGTFWNQNSSRTRRRDFCHVLPRGSPLLLPPIEIGNVCTDTGVVTGLPANDARAPIDLLGTRGGDERICITGSTKAASRESAPRQCAQWLPTNVAKAHLPRIGARLSDKDNDRDGKRVTV